MDDLLRRLGRRIRDLRVERGFSQEQFADVCRVHRTYMGHLERGEKNVSLTSIVRVSGALGISLSELFAGVDGDGEQPVMERRKKSAVGGIERDKFVRELAVLERCVAGLRELATATETDQPQSGHGAERRRKP